MQKSFDEVKKSDYLSHHIPDENIEGQFRVWAVCRACDNPITIYAQFEDGVLYPMSTGRGAKCNTHKCGDKFPAVFLGMAY